MPQTTPIAARPQKRRFFLEGLATPLSAEVAHQDACGVTLRQELPFLQLHRSLRDESGRIGELKGVSVTMRDGVANLVLDVRYKGGRPDATVPFLIESTRAMRATKLLTRKAVPLPHGGLKRRDETIPFGLEPRLDGTSDQTADLSIHVGETKNTMAGAALPAPRTPSPNTWWARLWRSFLTVFR